MRFRDKNGPNLYPILKPPDLPDFFAAARSPSTPHFIVLDIRNLMSISAFGSNDSGTP